MLWRFSVDTMVSSRKEFFIMTRMTFKIVGATFRKLDDPFENANSKKYVFYADINNVPKGIPMDTNPREQKLTSAVAKAIEYSLCSNDGYFHLKNRGIVLSARKVMFNNKREEVTIEFDDTLYHGNIDGGHTYKIICEHQDENPRIEQYVQFEIMTGVEDIIEDLARSRNTSVQVDEKSMAELAGKFDPIKDGIEGMPFYPRIAFKMNQVEQDSVTGKNLKMIDAREIVAIISMFDIEKYTPSAQPIQAYSSKGSILNQYLKNPEHYRLFVNIAPDIFDLYDTIEMEFAEAYNSTGKRYGGKKFSGYKDGKPVGKSKFMQNSLTYKIPDGLLYPTLSAFRSLVRQKMDTGKYYWIEDPLSVWARCKSDLVGKIMTFTSSIGDNPNKVGKDSNIWDLAYMTVAFAVQG